MYGGSNVVFGVCPSSCSQGVGDFKGVSSENISETLFDGVGGILDSPKWGEGTP